MTQRVFLDHAATTPVREEVLSAMLPWFQAQGANPAASYTTARESKKALENARSEIAALISASPSEVYFTSGGTEADNWALRSLIRPEKQHIVTSASEHHAVLDTCRALEKKGCAVSVTPVDKDARAKVTEIREALRDDTAIVSVMYANNETGAINPIREIADQAHERGVPLHSDAVAAAGHVRINVANDEIDLLTMSAHKFYGPVGSGVLYIREGLKAHPMHFGGRQERGLRAGTQNVAGAVGMATALRLATDEMSQEAERLHALRSLYMSEIRSVIPDAVFLSDSENTLPGILSIQLPGIDAGAVLIHLDRHGFEAAAGSACATGARKPSHVLLAAGLTAAQARCVLRISLGRSSRQCDAARFAACLQKAAVPRQK